MASLGTLAVNIVARTEKFTAGITKSIGQIDRLAGRIATATKVVGAFTAATGIAGVAIGTALVKHQLDAIDAIGKTSDRLGIQTERLIELQLAAEEAGVSTGTLETGLVKLTRVLADASQGKGAGVGALKTLGLSAVDLRRMEIPNQLQVIADKMAGLKTQGDRVSVAMQLFGRGGAPMLSMLANGREAMSEAALAANKLGLVFNRDMFDAVQRANDAFGRVLLTIQGLARQIAIRVAPVIEHLAKQFVAFVTDGDRINKLADSIARAFVKAGGFIVRVFFEVKAQIREVSAELFDVLAQLPKFMIGDKSKDFQLKANDFRNRGSLIRFSGNAVADKFENAALLKLDEWMKALQAATKRAEHNLAISGKALSLPATVSGLLNMVGKAIGQGPSLTGRAIGAFAPTAFGAMGKVAGGMDPGRSLQFAETGSVESYRQRAAIRRQADGDKAIKKVAENTADAAEFLKQIWGKVQQGITLLPANIGGG